jgi:hypothetical protein
VLSAFVWVQLWMPVDPETQARTRYCTRDTVEGNTTTVELGNTYAVWLENAVTGIRVTETRMICLFREDPDPQPPPPPPTEAEFVAAAKRVVTTQTSLNPRPSIGGLTGLDTWLWCVDPGAVQVGVALRGWTAEATVESIQYAWSIAGTDSAERSAEACGSEESPAATWMPETMGPYSVTLTSTWAGTWELAYLGEPAGVFPLGPYDFAAPTVPYPVGEYRGSLTPPVGESS